jgi:hypothetical protein
MGLTTLLGIQTIHALLYWNSFGNAILIISQKSFFHY